MSAVRTNQVLIGIEQSNNHILEQRKVDGAVGFLRQLTALGDKFVRIRNGIIRTRLERAANPCCGVTAKLRRLHKSGIRGAIQQQEVFISRKKQTARGTKAEVLPAHNPAIARRHRGIRYRQRFSGVINGLHSIESRSGHKVKNTRGRTLQEAAEVGTPTARVDSEGKSHTHVSTSRPARC